MPCECDAPLAVDVAVWWSMYGLFNSHVTVRGMAMLALPAHVLFLHGERDAFVDHCGTHSTARIVGT